MNPLSAVCYYRRHKRQAVMLTALLALAVVGLYLVLGVLLETFITPLYTVNRYLSRFSLVQPDMGALDPAVAARIGANPDVAVVLPQNHVEIAVPNAGGVDTPFRLIGLQEADMDAVLTQSGVRLVEGQLPQPGANGLALSRELATALDLGIGDTLKRTENNTGYANIASPLEVVGILSGDVRLGIVSYEYLDSQEGYRGIARYGVLVIARPGREAAVDDLLRQTVRSPRVEVATYHLLREYLAESRAVLYKVGIPLVLLVTAAITMVVGAINRLAFMQRLTELGTLHAVGHGKGWLARRLTLETAGLALAGGALGIALAMGIMALLNAAVYAPKGFAYNPFQMTALPFVAPIPLAVIGFTLFTAVRALGRMDAVAIVERGALSLEEKQTRPAARARAMSLPHPLAATTFYRRHKGQAAVLIGATALMIVSASLFVFGLESFDDARQPLLNHLRQVSVAAANGLTLEPGTVELVRAHPAVERVIPAMLFSPLGIYVPPIAPTYPVEAYGVTAEDMAYLVELYGLRLREGHLPRPNSNELAIPWTVAQNRGLQVGDVIGNRDHPVHADAPTLPTELVVSGILAQAEDFADDNWLSFMSLEFAESHPDAWKVNLSLVVAPKAGQKEALDAWLESEIAGEGRLVFTYGNQRAQFQSQASSLLLSLSLVESIIAVVAAVALAGLNYIFVMQRRAELGVSSALGLSRLQLVGRIVRETLFTSGAAWLAAVLGGAAILVVMQYGLFVPAGVRFNLFNPVPWLYTLPVPAAVLAVSAGAVGRALSRLDAVALIEGRA
ncbi:MAG: ABC transporter permease [Anaerolineae bacterium]|nr:ABC transporter permease [Anaerolineae bacterium]